MNTSAERLHTQADRLELQGEHELEMLPESMRIPPTTARYLDSLVLLAVASTLRMVADALEEE